MKGSKGYLPTLDGWRAVAIMAVILDHYFAWHVHTSPILPLTHTGPDGVSLFFAISGFLICSRLLEEGAAMGGVSLKGFYIRRASRILPAALMYLGVILLLSLAGLILVSPWDWWSSLLFFRNYLTPSLITRGWGGYTVHYWSLAVEEHFYLLWPGLMVLSGRKRAAYVAGTVAIVVSLWRWWDFHHHWMDRHLPGLLFGSRTDVRLDGLLMGCLAALLLTEPKIRRWAERSLGWPTTILCICLYAGMEVMAHRHNYSLCGSILLSTIVVSTVLHPTTWIGHLLETPVARWLGRLSYSLYLWQELFTASDARYPISLLQKFPLNLFALVGIATLSYRYIERPMIRLGHRLAPPATPGRQDMAPTTKLPD
jgi:peptidoglycan/LPS O-acetylase OafA/YrhL